MLPICSIPFYDSCMQQKVQNRALALQAEGGSLLSFLQHRTQYVSPRCTIACLIPEGSCYLMSLTVLGDYYRRYMVPTYRFDIILQRCKEVSSCHTQALCLLHIHFHFVAGLIKAMKDTEIQRYCTRPLINFHARIQPCSWSVSIKKMLLNRTFVGHMLDTTGAIVIFTEPHPSASPTKSLSNSCSTPLGGKLK